MVEQKVIEFLQFEGMDTKGSLRRCLVKGGNTKFYSNLIGETLLKG